MRRVPWRALVSSLAAPVLLIGGWTVAAAAQPARFDAVVRTISELAARDTPHRWLMTSALVGVGLSHVVTALALRPGTGMLLLTIAWFFDELLMSGQRVGPAERVAAGAQAMWPLAVVLSVRRSQPHLGTVPVEPGHT